MLEINLTELESLLGALKGGVSSKNNGFDLLYFSDKKISTFNDEVAVSADFNSLVTALVPFNEFYDAVKKLNKTEPTAMLDRVDMNTLLLKVKRAQLAFTVVQDDTAAERYSIPTEQLDKAKWYDLPENFAEIMASAAACTSTNRTTYMLTCVYIHRHDIFGADLTSAYWAQVPENLETMAINNKHVKSILQINPDKYTCTESFYHFLNSDYNCIMSVRRVNGTYPDYKKFFEVTGSTVTYNPDEAKKALELASVLVAKDENVKVTAKQTKNDVFMYVQGSSTKGNSQSRFAVSIDSGKLPSFAAPPAVLKRCFEQADTFIVSNSVLKCDLQDGSYVISLTQE